MMKISKTNIILYLVIIFFLTNFDLSHAASNGLDVNLEVGSCNNNGVCEKGTEDMFSCPVDCTPTEVPSSSSSSSAGSKPALDNVFKNLTVEVKNNSALIQWKSTTPTKSSIRWGESPDSKDGAIENINYLLDHKIELTDLKDGTTYYFSIEALNLLGKKSIIENQFFKTLSLVDTIPPGNVTNVSASSTLHGLTVSWVNPSDIDFDYIRVMKNTEKYFGSPSIGYLVYEGKGNYFTDSNVKDGVRYYYVIYSRDKAGNYSSGSIVDIIFNPSNKEDWQIEVPPIEEARPVSEKYIVTQASSTYDFFGGNVLNLNGDMPIIVKTNYVAENKNDDLWVEIRGGDGSLAGKYLFSRLRDKEGYVSMSIPVFENPGYYNVVIYRYKNGGSQIINHGGLKITKISDTKPINPWWVTQGFTLLMVIVLYCVLNIFRRFMVRP